MKLWWEKKKKKPLRERTPRSIASVPFVAPLKPFRGVVVVRVVAPHARHRPRQLTGRRARVRERRGGLRAAHKLYHLRACGLRSRRPTSRHHAAGAPDRALPGVAPRASRRGGQGEERGSRGEGENGGGGADGGVERRNAEHRNHHQAPLDVETRTALVWMHSGFDRQSRASSLLPLSTFSSPLDPTTLFSDSLTIVRLPRLHPPPPSSVDCDDR